MQYLKIERLVIKEITDKEARFLRKKRVFHTISLDLDLTIFDVDKYAPEQIIEFLHFNPPKRKQWLIFLI